MAAVPAVMFQQLADEVNVARGQIAQLSAAQDTLRAQAATAIAASEARTAALIQQQNTSGSGGGGGKCDWLELVGFKVAKPADFHGKREESWKLWSRSFKTYCNVRKEGVRKALEWAEGYSRQVINETSVD